jgi:hypothetical protein
MEAAKFPQCVKLGGHRNSHPVWRAKDIIDHLELFGLVIREVDVAS